MVSVVLAIELQPVAWRLNLLVVHYAVGMQ